MLKHSYTNWDVRELKIQLVEDGQTILNMDILTEAEASEVIQGLQKILFGEGSNTSPKPMLETDLSGVGKKYLPLAQYLVNQTEPIIRLTFDQISEILRRPLPPTASGEHARSWWANTDSHSQGKAWLTAGYKVNFLDAEQGVVEWQKM